MSWLQPARKMAGTEARPTSISIFEQLCPVLENFYYFIISTAHLLISVRKCLFFD